jgi:hypothetical protein
MPGAKLARSFAWNKENHTKVVTTGSPDDSGIPRASGFTVSFVVSLVIGLSCHHRQNDSANLISASRYQDATTSPSASPVFAKRLRRAKVPFVFRHLRVHRLPRPTFVTIAKRPS